jgi:hypothetical protein
LGKTNIFWQDIPTVPGHLYRIRFAQLIGGSMSSGSGDAQISVSWDTDQVGVSVIPAAETAYWHWSDFLAVASNTTSRISFESLTRAVEVDAFSVVDASVAPAIVTQPSSTSTVGGGTAAFVVGASGGPPLRYQWYFANAPLANETGSLLTLSQVSADQKGSYYVTVTNGFGAVTSAVVSLAVDAPTWPTIVWQPYGDTVPAGGNYRFNVAAIGTLPLQYQWFFQGTPIAGATNETLALSNVQPANAGSYQVSVHNSAGAVWSLSPSLFADGTNRGGGAIMLQNQFGTGSSSVDAPIFDLDGITRLNGGSYLAQLYAGPSTAWLRPVGQPTTFRTGFGAGYVWPKTVTLANVPPGSNFVAQVRAWDGGVASSYEAARALGGRFGKSEILTVTAGGAPLPSSYLLGLHGFSLQAGLPRFTVGEVRFVERQPEDILTWSVTGEPGYCYLVEKAGTDFIFRPYVVVTNVTGTVTFTDSANSDSAVTFYRTRILE